MVPRAQPTSFDARVLAARILALLGATSLAGCSSRTASDLTDDGADEAETTSGAGSSEGESSGTGSSEGESSDEAPVFDLPPDDGPILDLGGGTEEGTSDEHAEECSAFAFLDWQDEEQIDLEIPPECESPSGTDLVCFWPPEGSTCEDHPVPDYCIVEAYECGLASSGLEISCGPTNTGVGACCYVVIGDCPIGRPFVVEGHARLASASAGERRWSSASTPELDTLGSATRAALADAYLREGLSEHASFASFARFTAQLQRLAAPPELIVASLRAGLDELEHARRCFGLAGAYAGAPVGPAALDVHGCLVAAQLEPEAIATSLAREGCVAETVSLLLLAAARDRARDPVVRACLSATLDEELEHVLLAWQALAWLLGRHPRVREAVAAVFAGAEQHVGFGARSELPGDARSMRAHGYLAIGEREAIARDALARVVAPAGSALLARVHPVEDPASEPDREQPDDQPLERPERDVERRVDAQQRA